MFNIAIINGRLTKDVNLEVSEKGNSYVKNSVAIRQHSNNNKNDVQYMEIVVFGEQAKYLSSKASKGSFVSLAGNWVIKSYQNQYGDTIQSNQLKVFQIGFVEERGDKKVNENSNDFSKFNMENDLAYMATQMSISQNENSKNNQNELTNDSNETDVEHFSVNEIFGN
ncbi:single-stranded DNA-binding protein [Candidatus Mycoplasma pogonae]